MMCRLTVKEFASPLPLRWGMDNLVEVRERIAIVYLYPSTILGTTPMVIVRIVIDLIPMLDLSNLRTLARTVLPSGTHQTLPVYG
jgi:hypothetical protein